MSDVGIRVCEMASRSPMAGPGSCFWLGGGSKFDGVKFDMKCLQTRMDFCDGSRILTNCYEQSSFQKCLEIIKT